ncbi:hypothetical protein BS50DRAFT_616779 [Corynespora cassiicola Philippines]|uniref:Zn(2)-C6 fungal-type domain-containing protein n=1 Tax=Corynespora cassiicola Philippines TaxID=1448308 RepID=A0A2T2P6T6_CORCC|nr:hypothetical protein BS50DRAFT_616779 [Corynespora cassiicola Philippines]
MPPSSQHSRNQRHNGPLKRSYVACIPCRTRKVRCVIGTQPPCQKCAREHRECRFEVHEKSWKHRETPKWAGNHAENAPVPTASSEQEPPPPFASPSNTPTSQIASPGDTSPRAPLSASSHHPSPSLLLRHADPSQAGTSPSLTDRVVSSMVTGPNDALDILFDAASSSAGPANRSRNLSLPQVDLPSSFIPVIRELSDPQDNVLDLWDRCRFVRQGWFTAQEAVTYVDLFYQYFAPLSPIVSDAYCAHESHHVLICEEPMLCCTILTIASRYFILPGSGGHSRSHFIHQRLWQYCELLIRRVMFGQEKHSTAKTRILGTIESFILISDWHPRAIHFPPETEGWDGELISPAYDRHNRRHRNGESPLIRWREDVFEPSKRSERMSWMLLGSAVNLAYELGVFSEASSMPSPHNASEEIRSVRIRKSLYIYVTQMASRLGCASILPDNFTSTNRLTSTNSISTGPMDIYIDLWMSIARLTKVASAMFFPSVEYTKQTVLNGQYAILLDHFSSTMKEWREDCQIKIKQLPDALQNFLTIEHCYLQAYTNALSIQAAVEKALARGIRTVEDCQNGSLQDCLRAKDLGFIREVLHAGRTILEAATDLATKGLLRCAPFRITTYITCSSVLYLKAVFLCHAASVDGDRRSPEDQLQPLDDAIISLRSCAVDDMDFSSRYATLIEKQLFKLRVCIVPERSSRTSTSNGEQPPTTAEGNPNVQQDLDLSLMENMSWPENTDSPNQNPADPSHIGMSDMSWWSQPFDPSLAPFTGNYPHYTLGFEIDSLDFLLNLSQVGGLG